MYSFISILILIVCLLLVLIVLVQNSKGGGLAANFAETGQMMGVRKTADFLEKATWTLATALMLFCIVATASLSSYREEVVPQSRIMEQVQRTAPGAMQAPLPVQEGDESGLGVSSEGAPESASGSASPAAEPEE